MPRRKQKADGVFFFFNVSLCPKVLIYVVLSTSSLAGRTRPETRRLEGKKKKKRGGGGITGNNPSLLCYVGVSCRITLHI
jgi:hypothetical protein